MEEQSADIAMGVNESFEVKAGEENDEFALIGAGDQGMMFGYACSETEELMPLSTKLAHVLALRLAEARKDGTLPYLGPDGKTQVTVEYNDGKVTRIDTIVVSTMHSADVSLDQVRDDMMTYVVDPVLPSEFIDENTKFYVNPTGRFVIGGPMGDSGLTGRKIIVDTYGGMAAHGGGAFSGKDPSKVDRSAAYYARYAAKNIVAAGLADRCQIQVAYAIGVDKPVSICVKTYGTSHGVTNAQLEKMLLSGKIFDFRPYALTEALGLASPKGWKYEDTAAYGHFGRKAFPWERTDKVDALKDAFKIA
jgi:S-adenosylmethionine synthetase